MGSLPGTLKHPELLFQTTHPITTQADTLNNSTTVKLPRSVRHVIEKQSQNITFEESRIAHIAALKELRTVQGDNGISGVEALVSGSREEMKVLYEQLVTIRHTVKKLENAYLYHYWRMVSGERTLAKVTKVAPNVSGKERRQQPKDRIKEGISKLSPDKQAEANRLLKELGIL
ncbi:MAG: hypothetical protein KAR43_05530 [Deltaproteobacteria bacterium]|nr:hypothetical protein [Deltaproteobacteria bacterium]